MRSGTLAASRLAISGTCVGRGVPEGAGVLELRVEHPSHRRACIPAEP